LLPTNNPLILAAGFNASAMRCSFPVLMCNVTGLHYRALKARGAIAIA
jgi:hypothetical protein